MAIPCPSSVVRRACYAGGMRALALLCLLLAVPAMAKDRYVGTITGAGTSVTNLTTAAPFTLGSGAHSIQCSADALVLAGESTVSASTGVAVSAGQLYTVWLSSGDTIAVLLTGTCRVYTYLAPPSGR